MLDASKAPSHPKTLTSNALEPTEDLCGCHHKHPIENTPFLAHLSEVYLVLISTCLRIITTVTTSPRSVDTVTFENSEISY